MKKDKIRSGLKRGGWLFLVILFVVTTFGAAVGTFWVASHQNDDSSQAQNTTPPPSATCTFDGSAKAPALPKPEVYKPKGDVTTLQVTDLKKGTGNPVKSGDCVVMKYYGSLAKDGKLFDQNYDKSTGLKFTLGAGNVIPGWDQGLVGMKAGGTRRLVIPSDLAYGKTGQGPIPANADLVFIVYLDSIQ